MTSKLSLLLILSLLPADAIWPVAATQGQPARSNIKPIHISQLNRRKVIGSLGHPLGTVVTVEGIAADESYTRRKADAGETLLRVQTVNGKALRREVILNFHAYEGTENKNPFAGMRFKYIGYETGGFSGIPEAAFAYVPRVATSGYHFSTSFVVLRDDNGSRTSMKTRP